MTKARVCISNNVLGQNWPSASVVQMRSASIAVCGNDDLDVFADRYHSRLTVALLAALNAPVASWFIANHCNSFAVAAMRGAFLFSQTLFARAWQFAAGASSRDPDLTKKILVSIPAKDQF